MAFVIANHDKKIIIYDSLIYSKVSFNDHWKSTTHFDFWFDRVKVNKILNIKCFIANN